MPSAPRCASRRRGGACCDAAGGRRRRRRRPRARGHRRRAGFVPGTSPSTPRAPASRRCACRARSWWRTGSADVRPHAGGDRRAVRHPVGLGSSTPIAATWRCSGRPRACSSRACRPTCFYDLMLAARKPRSDRGRGRAAGRHPADERRQHRPPWTCCATAARWSTRTRAGAVHHGQRDAGLNGGDRRDRRLGRRRAHPRPARALTNAIGGILGTGLAVFIALRPAARPLTSSRARSGLTGPGDRLLGLRSMILRPLVGFIVAPIYHIPPGWYRNPQSGARSPRAPAALAIVFRSGPSSTPTLILAGRERALAGLCRAGLATLPRRAVVLLPLRPRRLSAGIDPRRAARKARALTFPCRRRTSGRLSGRPTRVVS